jgi:HEAT repeat protein
VLAVLLVVFILFNRGPNPTVVVSNTNNNTVAAAVRVELPKEYAADPTVTVWIGGRAYTKEELRKGIDLKIGDNDVEVRRGDKPIARGKVAVSDGDGDKVVTPTVEPVPSGEPPAITPPTPPEKGFVALFNGRDLTGWEPHPSDKARWEVKDGVLIGGGGAGCLFSKHDDYENFDFLIEAKINEGGNSGQYFRARFGPAYPQGYEAQINRDAATDGYGTGSLYGIVRVTEKLHKPDEWFTQEVIADGDHIVIKVNGKVVVDAHDKKHTKGRLALQAHDAKTVVCFRRVEVKELPAGDKPAPPAGEPSAAVKALLDALQDKDAGVRATAAQQLGGHKAKAVTEALALALSDPDDNVTRQAARSLLKLDDPAAVPALVERAANDRFSADGSGGGKDAALEALRALDSDQATPALLRALKSKKPDVRVWALQNLAGQKKDKAALEAILPFLKNDEAYYRGLAANALRDLGDPAAAPALMVRVADDVWASDGNGGGKAHALAALRALAPDKVAEALQGALKSKTPEVRAWALTELSKEK